MAKRKPTIVSVVGARPQFIKLAALLKKLDRAFNSHIVHTGQHFDEEMSETFFAEYKIREPDKNLNIKPGPVGKQLGRMITGLERYFREVQPRGVLVYGDTTSTMAGALAAATLKIPVGHVEAGLRSFDIQVAEEQNRVVADHLSRWLFCPTQEAMMNLNKEDIATGVYGVGDLMSETHRTPRRRPRELTPLLADLNFKAQDYYFITAHRAETVDELSHLEAFLQLLAVLDKPGIFPLHPRTKKRLREHKLRGALKELEDIHVLPPVNHRSALWLAANSAGVLTDSGGLQKEAYWAGVRCWTMREISEWAMLVRSGWNTLVGLSSEQLQHYLSHPRPTQDVIDPVFIRTNTSSEIVRILKDELR